MTWHLEEIERIDVAGADSTVQFVSGRQLKFDRMLLSTGFSPAGWVLCRRAGRNLRAAVCALRISNRRPLVALGFEYFCVGSAC